MAKSTNNTKCYNSFSCILSVLLIVFLIGSIVWDMLITKPAMRESIDEIKTEVQVIHKKLDAQSAGVKDSVYTVSPDTAK